MTNMLRNWKLPCFHFLHIYQYQTIYINLFAVCFIHWNESSIRTGVCLLISVHTQYLKKCLAHRQAVSIY